MYYRVLDGTKWVGAILHEWIGFELMFKPGMEGWKKEGILLCVIIERGMRECEKFFVVVFAD